MTLRGIMGTIYKPVAAKPCRVVSNRSGDIGFVFDHELTPDEAARFHEDVGVWPMHTVNGQLVATKPKAPK